MTTSNVRPEAAQLQRAFGSRRLHLAALDAAVQSKPELASGIVLRDDLPMLNIISTVNPTRMTEVGCEFADDDWWYTKDGEKLGRVDDREQVTDQLADLLSRHTTQRR